jgi:enhancing lycopene biosynthesis protein 2
MGTHALIFAAEGMQDIGIGRLTGREVHSRSVMTEGARADRGNDALESFH